MWTVSGRLEFKEAVTLVLHDVLGISPNLYGKDHRGIGDISGKSLWRLPSHFSSTLQLLESGIFRPMVGNYQQLASKY